MINIRFNLINFESISMSYIKNIIFDLGNVLLPISYENCFAAFQHYSSISINKVWFESLASSVFSKQEIGQLNNNEFCDLLRTQGKMQATDTQILEAWNTLLLDIPMDRYQLLKQLKTHYNIYLLSNTNSIHQQTFEQRVYEQTNGKTLQSFFTKTYYSHKMGIRKPDSKCYKAVLEDAHLQADETLFIDDNEDNVISAAQLGIHTIHLENFNTLNNLLTFTLSK